MKFVNSSGKYTTNSKSSKLSATDDSSLRTYEQKVRKKSPKRKQRRNRQILLGGVLIFIVIMISTLLFFAIRKSKAVGDFRKLIKEVQQVEKNDLSVIPDDAYIPRTEPTTNVSNETVPAETEPLVKTILPKYADLYLRNTEFYGWIEIEGTKINYPVMRSFENNDEYLYANFDGEYSYAGIPFVDYKCSHESDNLLIYGHNMKDGTMFRDLIKYEKESYWEKHPTIVFSDLYEDYEYEVLAAFYDRVYLKTDTCFKFYQFIDAADAEDFDYAIFQFKAKSIYDTGVEAEYGDKLITLITCAYHEENGRFVVVARRK